MILEKGRPTENETIKEELSVTGGETDRKNRNKKQDIEEYTIKKGIKDGVRPITC